MARNVTTTVPAHVALIEAAQSAYESATGADKARVRRDAEAAMKAALGAANLEAAQAWLAAIEGMVPAKVAAPTVDWNARAIDRAASLLMAAQLIVANAARPGNIPSDVALDVTWDAVKSRAEAGWNAEAGTDAHAVSVAANDLAAANVGRSTVRNSIADVIERAFAGYEGDRLTIAQVAKRGATETYQPGSGAIAARMFGGSGVPGFVAIEATATTPRMIAREA